MFLLVATLFLFAAPVQAAAQPALQHVKAELSGGAVALTFTTSEPSVPGAVRMLESPMRLYFDVPGFRPGSRQSWDLGLGPVRQVRAALNQPSPAILRVVVDLTERATWRVEPGPSPREFRLVIASAASAAPSEPIEPVGPVEPVEPASQILTALSAMTPILESMRAGDGPSDAALTVMMSRAETLAGAARALGTGSHDAALLQVAADAVLSASRARAAAIASGDAQSRANAVSAAAGALMLIDRLR